MAENVLEKIIKKKSERIVNLKKTISLDSLEELINTSNDSADIDFFKSTIFLIFFLIIFSRTFSAILNFF